MTGKSSPTNANKISDLAFFVFLSNVCPISHSPMISQGKLGPPRARWSGRLSAAQQDKRREGKAGAFAGMIRGARAMLGMTQTELAELAGISKTGLLKASTLAAIQEALERRGIEFIEGKRPGLRLKEE
jgi:hypothetical protein